jgi:hypothetical protein
MNNVIILKLTSHSSQGSPNIPSSPVSAYPTHSTRRDSADFLSSADGSMASQDSLHQDELRQLLSSEQGFPTLERCLIASESLQVAAPVDAGNFFGADNDEDDANFPTMPTAFDIGSSYMFSMSERPYLATYDMYQAGDPLPSPLNSPLAAWQLPTTSDIRALQQQYQYYGSLFGDEFFFTDTSTSSPGAPGVAVDDWPSHQADNLNTWSFAPSTLLEATPYTPTLGVVGQPPPRTPMSKSISHETSINASGDNTGPTKRARGRPRLYGPDMDSEDAGATNHSGESNTSLPMIANAGPSRRRASAPTGSEAAARSPGHRMAAKRYYDRVQSATDELEARFEALKRRRETLKSDQGELMEELYQLRSRLLEHAKCDCPLMKGYAAHVVRISTITATDQGFASVSRL